MLLCVCAGVRQFRADGMSAVKTSLIPRAPMSVPVECAAVAWKAVLKSSLTIADYAETMWSVK